jgi:hypothetical protein
LVRIKIKNEYEYELRTDLLDFGRGVAAVKFLVGQKKNR